MESHYLTTAQISKLLGRSEAAIRNLVMRRRIPFRRAGGRLTFIRSEIDQWIQQADGVRLEDLEEDSRR